MSQSNAGQAAFLPLGHGIPKVAEAEKDGGELEGAQWLWPILAWQLSMSLLLLAHPNSKDHALGFNRIMHTAVGGKDGSRELARKSLQLLG